MTGLCYEQVTGLVSLVEDYLKGWQPVCGRHHEMELFDGGKGGDSDEEAWSVMVMW
jgi:hypothetical protein